MILNKNELRELALTKEKEIYQSQLAEVEIILKEELAKCEIRARGGDFWYDFEIEAYTFRKLSSLDISALLNKITDCKAEVSYNNKDNFSVRISWK